jgi:polyisoprenoid-binding protein YceI
MKFTSDVKPHYFFLFLFTLLVLPQGHNLEAMKESSSASQYSIDPQKSQFLVYTSTAGLFGGLGHKHKISIPDFSGKLAFDPSDLAHSSLQMSIVAKSLVILAEDKKEEKDKPKIEEEMQTKVLDVENFPEITFRSTEISIKPAGANEYDAVIHGDLNLHGVTRNIPVNAKVTTENDHLTARGEFTLKQTDYQIKPPSAGGGTVKVKDELRFTFEIAAHL